jgi:hypothetical protein
MKHFRTVVASLLLLLIGGCSPHLDLNGPWGSRMPNPHERFYTAVAVNFGDSTMCEKISNHALEENGPDMGTTKWRVYLQKSKCYFFAAVVTKNAGLCDSVKEIVTIPSNKSEISQANCLAMLHLPNWQIHDNPLPEHSEYFFKEMGYGDRGDDFYMYLMLSAPPEQKQEFLKRAHAMPSFAN